MKKKVTIKIGLGVLILTTFLFSGCASTVTAPIVEGKPTVVKSEGLPPPSAGGGGVSMRVLWTVSDYKMGPNPVWDEKEARAMLFKPLDITATSITFDGKTCRDVTFQRETLKTEEYLALAFQTTPQTIGIAEEAVAVVKTNCSLPGFDQYLRLKDRRLVIYLNGVFFYFEPNVNY